jgi:quinol monooxygenase YgiN
MIVVIGRVTTDAQRRADLIRVAQAVVRASREDPGCLSYRMYEDTEVPNDFVFVEEWQDEESLQSHFRTPHIAEFMAAILATVIAPPDVRFHTIASSRDLSNVGAV